MLDACYTAGQVNQEQAGDDFVRSPAKAAKHGPRVLSRCRLAEHLSSAQAVRNHFSIGAEDDGRAANGEQPRGGRARFGFSQAYDQLLGRLV